MNPPRRKQMPRHLLPKALVCVAAIVLVPEPAPAEPGFLQLESKIPLGSVSGRIDHLAVDLDRRRLFVAELGNNSVGVIDLSAQKVAGRLSGFKEPQGVAYAKGTDTLYIANAGDGSVHMYEGLEVTRTGRIELGNDADSIRVDDRTGEAFVGYGTGPLAVIDSPSSSAPSRCDRQDGREGATIRPRTSSRPTRPMLLAQGPRVLKPNRGNGRHRYIDLEEQSRVGCMGAASSVR